MERIITNMHGYTFKVTGWKTYTTFPHLEGCIQIAMDKDSRTGQSITSLYTKDKYYMAVQSNPYGLWILYSLEYINYNELEDIRKAHIHGNRYHS